MDTHASNKPHPEIPEQDPANDINGKLTWTWLLGATVGVFVTFWLLAVFFNEVTHYQRVRVIELTQTKDLDAIRAREAESLAAGEGRIGINDAIQKYIEKQQGK